MRIGVRGSPRIRIPMRIVDEKVIAATSRKSYTANHSISHGGAARQTGDYG